MIWPARSGRARLKLLAAPAKELLHLIEARHGGGTGMPRDDDGAARIAQPARTGAGPNPARSPR